jgi:hypothetical protein
MSPIRSAQDHGGNVTDPKELRARSVGEWTVRGSEVYDNPFADVVVNATFVSPSNRWYTVPGFYDGDGIWRIRFSPAEAGEWTCRITARPRDEGLHLEERFKVEPATVRGYLRSVPGQAWGFVYESGDPAFILGDTTYNLFGMAHSDADVNAFMERRIEQGFNLLRVRVPVSPFHPPEGYSAWQTRRTWPWGGSEQKPVFDRFDLGYFHTVDRVVQKAETLGIGLEMIMEAWGFEWPFNRRDVFVPEWEELWMRYLIARYDAYNSVYFWTLMNEYEYYPDGDWRYNPVADRWAMRMGRWVKGLAPHGHIVAVHNGPREPAFAHRFRLDLGAIDTVMFQDWGTRDREQGWLAAGIEDTISSAFQGWPGTAIFSEWGYERNHGLPLLIPGHAYCCEEHTRRGAWRGAFCGMGIIHGFENSWGPFCILDEDQPGLEYLLHVRHFFTQVVPFERLRPAPRLVESADQMPAGHRPLALADETERLVAIYLPVGGSVSPALHKGLANYAGEWFNPCSGETLAASAAGNRYEAPAQLEAGHPQDWVLVLRSRS